MNFKTILVRGRIIDLQEGSGECMGVKVCRDK